MNFRAYFPVSYAFSDMQGDRLDLRLECFNSVDGSSRLLVLLGWFRFVCSNGLVIGESKIEINQRHGKDTLELSVIRQKLPAALQSVEADRARMQQWQAEKVTIYDVGIWADDKVSALWGKKAAARVFHICNVGRDVKFEDPFASGKATEKPVSYLERVPGAAEHASTKYDVVQALSYVATRRRNVEQPLAWQSDIPQLLCFLPSR